VSIIKPLKKYYPQKHSNFIKRMIGIDIDRRIAVRYTDMPPKKQSFISDLNNISAIPVIFVVLNTNNAV
jgi:hypothetical protein